MNTGPVLYYVPCHEYLSCT